MVDIKPQDAELPRSPASLGADARVPGQEVRAETCPKAFKSAPSASCALTRALFDAFQSSTGTKNRSTGRLPEALGLALKLPTPRNG